MPSGKSILVDACVALRRCRDSCENTTYGGRSLKQQAARMEDEGEREGRRNQKKAHEEKKRHDRGYTPRSVEMGQSVREHVGKRVPCANSSV